MAAKQLMLPANRAFNSNGVAEPGATAKLYTTGTSTPANFYSDSGLSVSLGATLTADGIGRFPTAYQDETTPFRLRVLDADGVELEDIDPFYFGLVEGADGANSSVTVGTVTNGDAGGDAEVTNSGTAQDAVFDFVLPTGAQGPAGDVAKAADRTALAAIVGPTAGMARALVESGREGLFVFDSSDLSTQVTNDPNQGIYVPPASDTTGASGAWRRVVSGAVNVKWFGAKGDSVSSAASGTDDSSAIQAAINYIDSIGGGTLYFPEGYYKVTSYLTLCQNIALQGAGRKSSVIVTIMAGGGGATTDENVRNGSVFFSNWTSNASNNANILIDRLGLLCSNTSNVGAGFYDNCGTFITIRNSWIKGFLYGVVFDQSELADVTDCIVEKMNTNGACFWLVNGAILKSGNIAGFTNRISIQRCQINGNTTNDLIRDDGGIEHCFGPGNNYNSGATQIRVAGASNFQIHGGEYEAGDTPIKVHYLASDGATNVGAAQGSMFGGTLADGISGNQVNLNSSGSFMSFYGVKFGGSGYPVTGSVDATLRFFGCSNFRSDRAWVNNTSCWLYVDTGPETIKSNSGTAIASPNGDYINGRMLCTNASGLALTITPDSTRTFDVGAYFELEQAAAGAVSYVAGSGVTITGPTATTAQHQRLRATKTAADTWKTQLILPDPTTPPSIASTGAITSSGGKIGYATGAGGTVTQATSKSTGVTLNKLCGEITLNGAALAANTAVTFTLTNSQIAAGDRITLNHVSGGTFGAYLLDARAAAGSATVMVRNVTAGSLSEAIVIGFAVVKAVTA